MTDPILLDGTVNNYPAAGGLIWGIALLLALVAGIGYAIERARTACRLIEQIIDEEAPRLRDDEDVESLVRGLDDSAYIECDGEPMNRSYWLDDGTWRDPDCIECGGEGAPCCEPPIDPPPRPIASLRASAGPDLPEAGHDVDTLRRLVAEDRAHLRVVDQMDPRWLRRRLAAQEPRPCPPWCSCHVDPTPGGAA